MLKISSEKLSPKKLLILDSMGALISGISLSLVLPWFSSFFQIPTEIAYFLASLAFLLFLEKVIVLTLVYFEFQSIKRRPEDSAI
jgi:hypothetical protein